MGMAAHSLGSILRYRSDFDGACACLEESVRLRREVFNERCRLTSSSCSSSSCSSGSALAGALVALGSARQCCGRLGHDTEALFREAIMLYQRGAGDLPKAATTRYMLSALLEERASTAEERARATDERRAAVEMWRQATGCDDIETAFDSFVALQHQHQHDGHRDGHSSSGGSSAGSRISMVMRELQEWLAQHRAVVRNLIMAMLMAWLLYTMSASSQTSSATSSNRRSSASAHTASL